MYNGIPNEATGHKVLASSYFDRLWKRSEQSKRFFFVLEKSNALGRKRTDIALPLAIHQNKKIKFDD